MISHSSIGDPHRVAFRHSVHSGILVEFVQHDDILSCVNQGARVVQFIYVDDSSTIALVGLSILSSKSFVCTAYGHTNTYTIIMCLMTIISDCNNNQLEVSVTSNGLKVSTLNNNGTVNGQQLPIEPPPPPPSLPATRLDQPSGGRPARGTKAIAPAHLKRNTIHGLYLNPNDNDWKAKLNHELTLYQKLLQEQTSQMGSSQMANDEQKPIRINENGWYRHKELDRIIKTEDQPIRTDVQEKILTPYECILHAMQYDKAWHKEISMGRRIGFYRFKGEIGNGNFSQVKVAVHSLTKEKVAIKILDKSRLDPKTQRMLVREIRSMETLHHPNLIHIFEVIETLSKHFIVMELASSGELFQVISTQGRFNESEGKFYFSQILSAINHMHQHNIIHRDIKAENVFFSDPYTVKVGDFGFSTRISDRNELLSTFCGSPPYAAPELFRDESYRGPYVDYWALGVLLYFMVTATMPFRAQTIVQLKKLILECRYDIPSFISVECCQLIAAFLQSNPLKRYTVEQARATRWLRNRVPIQSMPKYDLRTSYSKLLRHRRQSLIERQNFLDEYSLVSLDLANRPNRHSFVEPKMDSTTHETCKSATTTRPNSAVVSILTQEEKQTFRHMTLLGIDDQIIAKHLEKGSLSPIVGIFRITINRFLQEAQRSAISSRDDSCNDEQYHRTQPNRIDRSTSAKVSIADRNESEVKTNLLTIDSLKSPTTNFKDRRIAILKNVEQDSSLSTVPERDPTPILIRTLASDPESISEDLSIKTLTYEQCNKSKNTNMESRHSNVSSAKNREENNCNGKLDYVGKQISKQNNMKVEQVPRSRRLANENGTLVQCKKKPHRNERLCQTNVDRLSRSVRSVKNTVVDDKEVKDGHKSNELLDKSSTKPINDNKLPIDSSKHHVIHKTATLQILPNNCSAMFWVPAKRSIASRLRRSQTTPNVSILHKQASSSDAANQSAMKKSFSNNHCIIL
ncbi:hypothetical protein RDWZM_003159 [Blomia tropicalis]|uniref:non-specific serine/threonine protein kinase n=1 Tax=Blomia tropicalis TaxID=40697 RepID=A0A9Q0MFJ6_BLOTA|nr:hypothetical protein RDWZM_003159 [Blomia tropicalis]